jgi:hypothetical protein
MFKSCSFFRDHQWTTVAIDTSNGCHTIDRKTGVETFKADHIIKFQKCKRCKSRRITAEDPTPAGREFALNKHCDIALQRTIWEDSDQITKYNPKKIVWVDYSYAPARGMEEIIKQMYRDPKLTQLIEDNPSLKEAVDNVEFIAKMCKDNN